MACEAPCFNCPFSRHANAGFPHPWDFYVRHMMGDYISYICPEQDDVCFGQLTMMANQCLDIMIDNPVLKAQVKATAQDYDNYFLYNNEFVRFHEEGYVFGYEWTQQAKRQIGWIKPKKEHQSVQLTLL